MLRHPNPCRPFRHQRWMATPLWHQTAKECSRCVGGAQGGEEGGLFGVWFTSISLFSFEQLRVLSFFFPGISRLVGRFGAWCCSNPQMFVFVEESVIHWLFPTAGGRWVTQG